MSNLIVRDFQGQQVTFRTNKENGTSEVRINEVAKFCGWINITKGKEYVNWKRINEHLKTLGCAEVHNGDFIPEYIMYPLIGKANNEKATNFMLWVGQVLVQLRQTGVVITEAATDDSIDFEKKYGIYRIRKTFTNTINLVADYEEFKELAKQNRVSGADRVKRLNIIGSAVSNRLQENMAILKPSELMQMQELLTDIKADTLRISNKTNGGQKSQLTKKINKTNEYITEMKSYIDTIDPSSDEYNCINYHSFTENCIYGDTGEDGNLKFSKAYNVWRHLFPKNQFPDTTDVDFSKPVLIWMYFDHLEKFDVTNMSKSFLDMLCLNYGVDDHQINIMRCCTNNYVDDYSDGKIYYCIKNA